jgi:hypothetical protein
VRVLNKGTGVVSVATSIPNLMTSMHPTLVGAWARFTMAINFETNVWNFACGNPFPDGSNLGTDSAFDLPLLAANLIDPSLPNIDFSVARVYVNADETGGLADLVSANYG